jgi:hypothetical protein
MLPRDNLLGENINRSAVRNRLSSRQLPKNENIQFIALSDVLYDCGT